MNQSFQNKRVLIIKHGQATRNKNPSRERREDILTEKEIIPAIISHANGNPSKPYL
jgi:hypothetical protein